MTYKMESFQELLITEVQDNPCLYKSGDKNYKNTVLKNKVWTEIGHKLGIEGSVALTKWTSIRDRYIREKKNVKPKSGVGANTKKKPWDLYPLLWFLDRPLTYATSKYVNIEPKLLNTMVNNCELPENSNQWPVMKVEESVIDCPSTDKHFLRIDCVDNFGTDDSNSLLSPADAFQSDPLLHTKIERKRKLSITSESGIMSSTDSGRSRNSKEENFEERLMKIIKSHNDISSSEENNEYKNFCLSLVPIFKRLAPKNAAKLKIKILHECLNAEFSADL